MKSCYSKIPEFINFEKDNDWDFASELLKRYNEDFYFYENNEGFYCAYSKKPGNYHIWLLGVYPEHRGKNFSKVLINDFIKKSKEKNYNNLTVKSFNDNMIKSLVSCGFNPIGNNVFELTIQNILFPKN